MKPMSRLIALAPLLLGGLAACSTANGPSGAGRSFTLSVSTQAAPAPAPGIRASLGASPQIFTAGGDTLQIDDVQLVLRHIELHRVSGSACDTSSDGRDCQELELNPMLVQLPLSPGATQAFTVSVDTGAYDRLEFQIHRPESDAADLAFLQAHPDFQGVSIMATGSFNGTPFTFTSDLDVGQELSLVPPVSVTDSTPASLTIHVDLSTWFQAGGMLIDPSTANQGQGNEGVVRSNIEQSFHAFEDEDHDGCDDHSAS